MHMIGRTAVLLQTDFCSTSIESFNYLCVRVCATTKKVLLHEKFIINRKALEVKKKHKDFNRKIYPIHVEKE